MTKKQTPIKTKKSQKPGRKARHNSRHKLGKVFTPGMKPGDIEWGEYEDTVLLNQ